MSINPQSAVERNTFPLSGCSCEGEYEEEEVEEGLSVGILINCDAILNAGWWIFIQCSRRRIRISFGTMVN